MTAASVHTRGVSRLFRLGSEEVWAVRDVSLDVPPGEFLALIGRSGSGKTTLLNLMGGLDRPTEGELLIDDQRIDNMSEAGLVQLRRRDIGFVFQSFGLLPLLSALENVELPLRIAGFGHGDRQRMSREAVERVGLSRRANHRPYELSGGEQQRVAIARAIATRPRLILADEPTGELDSTTARQVFDLLRRLAREHDMTVLTCTHDRLVMELADRVEELADGHLVAPEDRSLWDRVRNLERSPFEREWVTHAPATVESTNGLEPAPAPATLEARPPSAVPAAPAETPPSAADDDNRWSRPGAPR